MRHARVLATLLVCVPIYLRGHHYTIVTGEAVDTWKPGYSHDRVIRPHTDVCRIVQVKKKKTGKGSGPKIYVAYRDGTVLDTESAFLKDAGHLASWGVKSAIAAAEKIAGVTGVTFEKLLLPKGKPDLDCPPEKANKFDTLSLHAGHALPSERPDPVLDQLIKIV